MAELQAKFVYDELTIADLERSLSLERLGPYLDLADGDRAYALLLYEWNIRVSEAMYSILQGFEVTLRNSIHDVMCIAHGRHDWYDVAVLMDDEKSRIEEAKRRIVRDGRQITPGRVVAELMFGFWSSLAGTVYAQTLWDRHLYKAFRQKKVGRKDVAKRLKKIRFLRNRVAHHESIIGRKGQERNLRQDVREILEATSWICSTTAKWVAHTSSFDTAYSQRPTPPQADLPLIRT
jgi:hypothetical protein